MTAKRTGLLMIVSMAILCMCMGFNDSPSPGSWSLLDTKTASNDATIDFANLPTAYRDFKIIGSAVVPATDAVNLYIRTSVASSWKSGASDYSWTRFKHGNGTNGNSSSTSDTKIGASGKVGSAATESMSFEMNLADPTGTVLWKQIEGRSSQIDGGGIPEQNLFYGSYVGAASAIDGIRFYFSSGNIESGTFTLYGRMN